MLGITERSEEVGGPRNMVRKIDRGSDTQEPCAPKIGLGFISQEIRGWDVCLLWREKIRKGR